MGDPIDADTGPDATGDVGALDGGAPAATVWAVSVGGEKLDLVNSMVVDEKRSVYLVGAFRDVAHFGSEQLVSRGESDVFITKLDANGKVMWAVGAGGDGLDVVTGYWNHDHIFASQISSEGTITWTTASFVGIATGGVTTDTSGAVYLAGHYEKMVEFGAATLASKGATDIFVAKLRWPDGRVRIVNEQTSSSGTCSWSS